MCYSNCKFEDWEGECTKRKNVLFDAECHCTDEEPEQELKGKRVVYEIKKPK